MNYHSTNICKKHIGSTDELIAIRKVTSATKPIVEPILDCEANREGRNRNPYDWTYSNITLSNITDRGYTGHELLHVYFYSKNMNLSKPQNATIYEWQYTQARKWDYKVIEYKHLYNKHWNYNLTSYNYSNSGVFFISTKPSFFY